MANILQGASFRVTCFDTDSVDAPVENSDWYRFLFEKIYDFHFSMPLPYIIYFDKYYHLHFVLKGLQLVLCTCFMHYLMLVIELLRAFVCSATAHAQKSIFTSYLCRAGRFLILHFEPTCDRLPIRLF